MSRREARQKYYRVMVLIVQLLQYFPNTERWVTSYKAFAWSIRGSFVWRVAGEATGTDVRLEGVEVARRMTVDRFGGAQLRGLPLGQTRPLNHPGKLCRPFYVRGLVGFPATDTERKSQSRQLLSAW